LGPLDLSRVSHGGEKNLARRNGYQRGSVGGRGGTDRRRVFFAAGVLAPGFAAVGRNKTPFRHRGRAGGRPGWEKTGDAEKKKKKTGGMERFLAGFWTVLGGPWPIDVVRGGGQGHRQGFIRPGFFRGGEGGDWDLIEGASCGEGPERTGLRGGGGPRSKKIRGRKKVRGSSFHGLGSFWFKAGAGPTHGMV